MASELDSLLNVLNLTPADDLDTFPEMWYQVFLWTLFSSFLVYNVAAVIAFVTLRKHKQGRFLAVIIFLSGILSPITVGLVTSAAIAGVYRASRFQMLPLYALIWGVGQTFLGVIMAFTRILATL